MGKSKIDEWCLMRKKLEGKCLPISYCKTKGVELSYNSNKLDLVGERAFAGYIDEPPLFDDCSESEFEGKEDDKELCEKPTFDYYYESEFEENQREVDDTELDKEPIFDDCYGSKFDYKELDFIRLLWSPKKNGVTSTNCEEEYG